ncbi:hypothetical protein [Marvinbryantia formatexigens]|nr:hypothetical protein [Marvinbryantia formatexigens]
MTDRLSVKKIETDNYPQLRTSFSCIRIISNKITDKNTGNSAMLDVPDESFSVPECVFRRI